MDKKIPTYREQKAKHAYNELIKLTGIELTEDQKNIYKELYRVWGGDYFTLSDVFSVGNAKRNSSAQDLSGTHFKKILDNDFCKLKVHGGFQFVYRAPKERKPVGEIQYKLIAYPENFDLLTGCFKENILNVTDEVTKKHLIKLNHASIDGNTPKNV